MTIPEKLEGLGMEGIGISRRSVGPYRWVGGRVRRCPGLKIRSEINDGKFVWPQLGSRRRSLVVIMKWPADSGSKIDDGSVQKAQSRDASGRNGAGGRIPDFGKNSTFDCDAVAGLCSACASFCNFGHARDKVASGGFTSRWPR